MKKPWKILGITLLVIIIIIGGGLFIRTRITIFKLVYKKPPKSLSEEPPEKIYKETINEFNREFGNWKDITSYHPSGMPDRIYSGISDSEIREERLGLTIDYFIVRLRHIAEKHPESKWADDAQMVLANHLTAFPKLSIIEYKKLIEKFPNAKIEEWTMKNCMFFYPRDRELPPTTIAQFNIAFIYYKYLKNYQKAIEESQKAINAFPNVIPLDKGAFSNVVICYHTIAKSYKELGDVKKAEETYQIIIDRFPDTKAARAAQKKIEELKS